MTTTHDRAFVEIESVTKRYDGRPALEQVSLELRGGETLALLGANGAGKTTLLKCIVGLLTPIEGRITIDGLDRRRDHLEIRRFTAWLADQPFLYGHFKGRSWLEMVADIYSIRAAKRDEQIGDLLEIFDLEDLADRKIASYSNGQYKKLAICGLLIANARLLILDEPFTGEIDPPGIAALRRILSGLRERGVTTILSTQMIAEAERLADRFAILHQGRLKALGSASELQARWKVDSLEDVLDAIITKSPSDTNERFLESFLS